MNQKSVESGAKGFYENHYGRSTFFFQTKIEVIGDLIALYLQQHPKKHLRVLDIGCGNGEPIESIVECIVKRGIIDRGGISLSGWDVSVTGVSEAVARGIKAQVKDASNAAVSPAEEAAFDIVIFSEVLEHLVDTGSAMKTIHRVLASDGALILTTPNLATWVNRILFQPFLTETSFEPQRFGHAFIYRMLGEKLGGACMAGHLRVFTYRALKEFVRYFKFDIVRSVGYSSHGDWLSRIISRLWTGGAGSLALMAMQARSAGEGVTPERKT